MEEQLRTRSGLTKFEEVTASRSRLEATEHDPEKEKASDEQHRCHSRRLQRLEAIIEDRLKPADDAQQGLLGCEADEFLGQALCAGLGKNASLSDAAITGLKVEVADVRQNLAVLQQESRDAYARLDLQGQHVSSLCQLIDVQEVHEAKRHRFEAKQQLQCLQKHADEQDKAHSELIDLVRRIQDIAFGSLLKPSSGTPTPALPATTPTHPAAGKGAGMGNWPAPPDAAAGAELLQSCDDTEFMQGGGGSGGGYGVGGGASLMIGPPTLLRDAGLCQQLPSWPSGQRNSSPEPAPFWPGVGSVASQFLSPPPMFSGGACGASGMGAMAQRRPPLARIDEPPNGDSEPEAAGGA
eukprot:NODE_8523_length_1489_cov_6.733480.p1 GENE.NODE_8523_length_1489_cov_6.733480~~NODE_8523_length_1489_cov_6.733480.p1  ORF type:complete len:391 (+),score=85.54 NODE_8523_length_1489_cov_6.733480:116-1174(+)